MKAIRVHEFGDADALRYEAHATDPRARRRRSTSKDRCRRTQLHRYLPAYRRLSAGAALYPWAGRRRSRRCGGSRRREHPTRRSLSGHTMHPGSYAEYVVMPVDRLVSVPEGIETRQAVAAMLQGLTAHYLATSTFPLQQGQRALVHAAAGGVGQLLVQMAKLRGAWVMDRIDRGKKPVLPRKPAPMKSSDIRSRTLRKRSNG